MNKQIFAEALDVGKSRVAHPAMAEQVVFKGRVVLRMPVYEREKNRKEKEHTHRAAGAAGSKRSPRFLRYRMGNGGLPNPITWPFT